MVRRTRLVVLLLILVVSVPVSFLGASTAGAAPPRLTVTDVTTTPATPTPEDPVTFSVTLRNSAGSPSPAKLRYVTVETDGGREVANATRLGTLSAGETLTVPVTGRFDTAGEKSLQVVAVGTDDDGNRSRVFRPVTVVVEDARPALSPTFDDDPIVAGAPTTVSVIVSNPTTEPIRDLTLAPNASTGVESVDGSASRPTLAAGETAVMNVSVVASSPGRTAMGLDLSYTTGAGVRAQTTVERPLRVVALEEDVGVRISPVVETDQQRQAGGIEGILQGATGATATQNTEPETDGEGPSRVEVTVTNFGNAPVVGGVLTPEAGGTALPRSTVPSLSPGESASVVVDLSTVDRSGAVTFDVAYETAGRNGSASTAYDYRPATGAVRVTGLGMTYDDDGRLRVTGNAGNVGTAEVTGVVVSVGESAFVAPSYPQRSYFVGTVDGSEFAPFELTAQVDTANVTAVPVTVSYRVDGVGYNRTVSVPYDDSLTPPEEGEGGGLSLGATTIAVVGTLVFLGGTAVYVVRRREWEWR
jgi:hypothetical protein